MNRRTVLVGTASTLSLGVAGCVGSSSSSPDLPDGMTVETDSTEREVLNDGLKMHQSPVEGNEYHTLITTEKEKDDRSGYLLPIAEQTNFSDSYLLIIQKIMQAKATLELDAIERTKNNNLYVTCDVDYPAGKGDVADLHSFIIRISRDEKLPKGVIVKIQAEAGVEIHQDCDYPARRDH